jgi:hypothetical protein
MRQVSAIDERRRGMLFRKRLVARLTLAIVIVSFSAAFWMTQSGEE